MITYIVAYLAVGAMLGLYALSNNLESDEPIEWTMYIFLIVAWPTTLVCAVVNIISHLTKKRGD